MHYCAYHDQEETDASFRLKQNGKLDSWCIEGRREYNREYSRKKYAPVKKQVAEKRAEKDSLAEKLCTGCQQVQPIEDFEFRPDRPGKRFSQCHTCRQQKHSSYCKAYNSANRDKIAVYKRDYHAANPGYNETSLRRRRARLADVRHESYTHKEIHTRDDGKCYFCGELVDLSLEYPDPMSKVVHHIHPISKKGADIRKNVAIAHHLCNREALDSYEPEFLSWEVRKISNLDARSIAEEFHYLHRKPNVSFGFGLFDGDTLYGVVTFGSPASFRISNSVCPSEPKKVIELNRLWLHSRAPFGIASWFVAKALKQLPPFIVVSYADTGASNQYSEPHFGGVYRALSFHYAGKSAKSVDWRLPGSTRNVGKKTDGSYAVEVPPKHRYWTVTGSKRQKRQLRQLAAWPSLDWNE